MNSATLGAGMLPNTLQTPGGQDVSHIQQIDFAAIGPGAIPKTPLQTILQTQQNLLPHMASRAQSTAATCDTES